jgi:hypothetical protein
MPGCQDGVGRLRSESAPRRSELIGDHVRLPVNDLSGTKDFIDHFADAEFVEVGVAIGVVTDLVTRSDDPSGTVGLIHQPMAFEEERGSHAVPVEATQ